jgi:endothelin-converting enzyme/putative endopeptidase
MDKLIKFCYEINCSDDFYSHVNYHWIEETEIPNGHSKWSVFQIIHNENLKKIKKLIEKSKQIPKFKKLFTIYSQYLDYNKRNDPSNILFVQQIFDRINSCVSSIELFNLMYDYELLINISFPLNTYVQSNFKDANEVILHIGSGGLGLPDKEYYFNENKKKIRDKYKIFIREYSKIYGLVIDPEIIFNIEKKLASKTYTKIQKRIPELNNNLSNWDIIIKSLPNLEFIRKLFIKAKIKPDKINITNPEYLKFINEFIISNDLFNWKQYFCFKIMLTFHNCLSEIIEQAYFIFYSGFLSGIQKMKPNWIRSIEFTESLLGHLLGQLYVEKHFDQASKNKVIQMIDYIKKELEYILANNDWMAHETKVNAIQKLKKINVKIGYPDVYVINYDLVQVSDSNPLLINFINIRSFEIINKLEKLYKPLNRNQWFMNCHAVNAYYSPSFNEIVFPAGILQAPFFSLDQNIGFNFGGIGSIIGHEIIHGFDDQGSKYDGDGNLNIWWTKEDFVKYKAKTDIVKKQYSDYKILDTNINGELTLGENIADIGGVYISLKAFERYLTDHPKENVRIYGFTPKQLFFINYANIWKSKSTLEEINKRLITDPHSPPEFRVNGVLKNIDEFYDEFNIKENDGLYLKPQSRIIIFSSKK